MGDTQTEILVNETSTHAFEPTLNSREAAALLQIHPKTLQKMARQGRIPGHRLAISGGSVRRSWTNGSAMAYPQIATRAVTRRDSNVHAHAISKRKFENEEERKWFESLGVQILRTLPDGTGERLSRAVTVGTLQEYPTETAARKSPAVQAILLRINASASVGACYGFHRGSVDRTLRTRGNARSLFDTGILPIVH